MRNPYFDLVSAGTEVSVANEQSFWSDKGYQKMSAEERLYFHEQTGKIVEFVEASRPRYRGYKVQLGDGSIVQYGVNKVRLSEEKYDADGSNRELNDILAGLSAASTRPDLPIPAQPGVARFTGTRPIEPDR